MVNRCSACFEIKEIVFSKAITGRAGQYNYCKDCNPNKSRSISLPNQNKLKMQKKAAIRGDPAKAQTLTLGDPELETVGRNARLKLAESSRSQTHSEEQTETCQSEGSNLFSLSNLPDNELPDMKSTNGATASLKELPITSANGGHTNILQQAIEVMTQLSEEELEEMEAEIKKKIRMLNLTLKMIGEMKGSNTAATLNPKAITPEDRQQIYQLADEGKSPAEIAEMLDKTERGVKACLGKRKR